MKITLQVDGREMTFSKEELTAILEEHFTQTAKKDKIFIRRPTEGVPFEVNPRVIDQKFFQEKRKDVDQEKTRRLILEAFAKMDENPERHGKPFKTLIPEKLRRQKDVEDLMNYFPKKLGGHVADWVEQALEWAQRIANGESWKDVCNKADTALCFRLIVWKNGSIRLVGGSLLNHNSCSASDVCTVDCFGDTRIYNAVPLIVLPV